MARHPFALSAATRAVQPIDPLLLTYGRPTLTTPAGVPATLDFNMRTGDAHITGDFVTVIVGGVVMVLARALAEALFR